jgi:hypothetical protein
VTAGTKKQAERYDLKEESNGEYAGGRGELLGAIAAEIALRKTDVVARRWRAVCPLTAKRSVERQ